ncbi:PiggyBac transposable element-derived protein 4 [Dictyocoela muelleri]|nr:PiggyBac transposable element-derived protein 4 [Dictyocoela muelleri]
MLGIKNVPNVQHCWNKRKQYSYNDKIAGIIKFSKFQYINNHITCISEKDVIGIKLKKSPKIIQGLTRLFNNLYIPGEHICIDEGMMPYKGWMKNNVYCPIKPDKWGMKFYILAETTTGYIYICNLRIIGEQSTINETVLHLCDNIKAYYRKLYMDNYYNSYMLTQLLLKEKIYTTGTLRHKRGRPSDLLILKRNAKENKTVVF